MVLVRFASSFFIFFFTLFLSDVEGKGGEGSGNEGKREKLIIF
jgi:hypothetical protein